MLARRHVLLWGTQNRQEALHSVPERMMRERGGGAANPLRLDSSSMAASWRASSPFSGRKRSREKKRVLAWPVASSVAPLSHHGGKGPFPSYSLRRKSRYSALFQSSAREVWPMWCGGLSGAPTPLEHRQQGRTSPLGWTSNSNQGCKQRMGERSGPSITASVSHVVFFHIPWSCTVPGVAPAAARRSRKWRAPPLRPPEPPALCF